MPQGQTQQNLNHHANQCNKNVGTPGQNAANAHVHGNRGAQLNPNNPANAHGGNNANPRK